MQQQNDSSLGKLNLWLIVIALVVLLVGAMLLLPGDKVKDIAVDSAEQALLIPEETEIKPLLPDPASPMVEELALLEPQGIEFIAENLPELNASDGVFFQDVLTVSEQLTPWLFKKQLIRKYVFASNAMSQGLRPSAKVLRELPFSEPFSVTQFGDKMYISERSYHRYDALAQAVNSIDNQAAVALYRKYESLFQTVFNELSYPKNYQVLDIIRAAVGKILQAPIVKGKVAVVRPSVRYKFADPKLEKLSALDKQMLRMGPENTQIIQQKLRNFMQDLIASE
ncbi:MAG: hypothetical protein methR_P3079 [Methyloprofundus sp.]|nr:MAG: hypothetical protein methR_P3079 [Methyloprofundus sp.]